MILVAVAALSWLQVFLSLFSNVISHTLVTHCRIHLYDILPILYFQPSSFVMLSFYTFDLGILLQSLRLWASIFFIHWCFTPCTYFPHFGTFVTQTRAGISYLGYFSVPPLVEFSRSSSAWAWTTDFWVQDHWFVWLRLIDYLCLKSYVKRTIEFEEVLVKGTTYNYFLQS